MYLVEEPCRCDIIVLREKEAEKTCPSVQPIRSQRIEALSQTNG